MLNKVGHCHFCLQKEALDAALFVLACGAAGLLQPGSLTDLWSLSADKQAWLIAASHAGFFEREGQCNNIEVFFNILSPDFHVTSACPACVLTCITAFFFLHSHACSQLMEPVFATWQLPSPIWPSFLSCFCTGIFLRPLNISWKPFPLPCLSVLFILPGYCVFHWKLATSVACSGCARFMMCPSSSMALLSEVARLADRIGLQALGGILFFINMFLGCQMGHTKSKTYKVPCVCLCCLLYVPSRPPPQQTPPTCPRSLLSLFSVLVGERTRKLSPLTLPSV